MAVTGKPQRQRNDMARCATSGPAGPGSRREAVSGGPERRYAPSQTHTIGSASLVAAVAGRGAQLVRLGAAARLPG
jgi:hypothetical protein